MCCKICRCKLFSNIRIPERVPKIPKCDIVPEKTPTLTLATVIFDITFDFWDTIANTPKYETHTPEWSSDRSMVLCGAYWGTEEFSEIGF